MSNIASLWLDSTERPHRPPLEADLHADVCVVGAGITGLSAALELARGGARVVVIEGRFVGAGATGFTTAKLSSLHGLTYDRLERQLGEDAGRAYGQANERGIARAFEAGRHAAGIDCDLRRKPNLTYTEEPDERDRVEDEARGGAESRPMPASVVEDAKDLPFPVAAAVRFADQAEFHPVKYLHGLVRALEQAGGLLFEGTFAVRRRRGRALPASTDRGRTVTAAAVVVATHLPFLDRGLYFARCHPERSYVVATPYDRDAAAGGMYLSTESPAHSIRTHELGEQTWLLVGGESHKTGQGNAAERYERLTAWARERFGVEPVMRWATQTRCRQTACRADRPGRPRLEERVRGHRLSSGGSRWASRPPSCSPRRVHGRDHGWLEAVRHRRLRVRSSDGSLAKENQNVEVRFFGDRVVKRARGGLDRAGGGADRRRRPGTAGGLSRRSRRAARALGQMQPPRLHRQLELRRGSLGLSLPRLALRAAGAR